MSDVLSPGELVGKADWEGGIIALLEYGINTPDRLDDSDPELKAAWTELCHAWETFEPVLEKVQELLPDPSDGWDE